MSKNALRARRLRRRFLRVLEVLRGMADEDVRQISKALAVLSLTDAEIEKLRAGVRGLSKQEPSK